METIRDVLISISSKLLDSHTQDMDSVIVEVLNECRVSLGVDRMSCLPLNNTLLEKAFHYESIGEGIPPVYRNLPKDVVKQYRDLIRQGDVACSDWSPEIFELATKLQPEKPLRHILVPISAMGKPWGLMACANFTSPRLFDEEFIRSATILGNIIASSIARVDHYEQLKRSRQEVAARNRRIIGERERERRNIARDLHDDFSQRLASLGLNLGFASNVCDESSREVIVKCASELSEITRDMQHLSRHLHPVVIEKIGLHAAIESHVKQLATRSGLDSEIDIDPTLQFDDDSALHIYRIVQESLSNVIKHAHASSVCVSLKARQGTTELVISDDGVGFDASELTINSPSLGVQSMIERAELIGGVVTFETTENELGALVRLVMQNEEGQS